jgi:hypothetical protein
MTKRLSRGDRSSLMRIGYIASLAAMAVICTFFFLEQNKRNETIQQIGSVSTEFAEVDHALRAIADRSGRLAQTYEDHQADVDPFGWMGQPWRKNAGLRERCRRSRHLSAVSSQRFVSSGPAGRSSTQ